MFRQSKKPCYLDENNKAAVEQTLKTRLMEYWAANDVEKTDEEADTEAAAVLEYLEAMGDKGVLSASLDDCDFLVKKTAEGGTIVVQVQKATPVL